MSFRFLGFLVFTISIVLNGYADSYAFSDGYYKTLKSAFRRIIKQETAAGSQDQLERLMTAILQGSEGAGVRDQILEVTRTSSLKAFCHEMNGRLDKFRVALTQAERGLTRRYSPSVEKTGKLARAPVDFANLRHDYFLARLTPEELAVLIHFYKTLNPASPENSLIHEHGLLKKETEIARQAIEATAFPNIEIRWHGRNMPLVNYTDNMRAKWVSVAQFFLGLDLNYELLQLYSQLVNQEAGHLKHRHIRTFEERFLLAVRRLALVKGDHFKARDLLLAYLSNSKSSQFLSENATLFALESPGSEKRKFESLSFFTIRLVSIKDRNTLIRFFTDGTLPRTFPNIESVQAQRIIHTYKLAAKEEEQLRASSADASCVQLVKVLSPHNMNELNNHLDQFR